MSANSTTRPIPRKKRKTTLHADKARYQQAQKNEVGRFNPQIELGPKTYRTRKVVVRKKSTDYNDKTLLRTGLDDDKGRTSDEWGVAKGKRGGCWEQRRPLLVWCEKFEHVAGALLIYGRWHYNNNLHHPSSHDRNHDAAANMASSTAYLSPKKLQQSLVVNLFVT
jgi:hypothetical protein